MHHVIEYIAHTAERAAIWRSVDTLMRGHGALGTLLVAGAVIALAIFVTRSKPRRH